MGVIVKCQYDENQSLWKFCGGVAIFRPTPSSVGRMHSCGLESVNKEFMNTEGQ